MHILDIFKYFNGVLISSDYICSNISPKGDSAPNATYSENDFEILREIISKVSNKVIAEGNIDTPQKAKRVLELGSYSVVVGSIITRPQNITKRFTNAIGDLR